MNILLIANKPPYPPNDGGTLATFNMAMGLADCNNNVTVIALSSTKHKSKTDQLPEEIKGKINIILYEIDASINIFQGLFNLIFSKTPIGIKRYFNPEISRLICNQVVNGSFDLIQIEGLYMLNYSPAIRKVFNGKIVYRAHNVEHVIWKRSGLQFPNIFKTYYFNNLSNRIKRVECKLSEYVDALVSITKNDNAWFVQNGFKKSSIIIPAGFFINKLEIRSPNKISDAICFIGSLDWIPNQEGLTWFLEKVWPILQNHSPELSFHIAGRNAPAWLVKKLFSQHNIIYHGEIDNSSEFLRDFSVAVVPLFSGSGMRVKIVELMLNHVVVVTTLKGAEGLADDIYDYLLIGDTPEQIAGHILQLKNNTQLATAFQAKAYTFAVNHFDANKHAATLTEFYKKLPHGC